MCQNVLDALCKPLLVCLPLMVVAQDCPEQVGIAWPPFSYDNQQQRKTGDVTVEVR